MKEKAMTNTKTKMKKESDIFIYSLGTGEYRAYPSPFVAHGPQAVIQFRNLTGDDITIDFGAASLNGKILTLKKRTKGVMTLARKGAPGLCQYMATVLGKGHTLLRSGRRMPILVKGGSPPEIIIDT
jgi:hypothetical protein